MRGDIIRSSITCITSFGSHMVFGGPERWPDEPHECKYIYYNHQIGDPNHSIFTISSDVDRSAFLYYTLFPGWQTRC